MDRYGARRGSLQGVLRAADEKPGAARSWAGKATRPCGRVGGGVKRRAGGLARESARQLSDGWVWSMAGRAAGPPGASRADAGAGARCCRAGARTPSGTCRRRCGGRGEGGARRLMMRSSEMDAGRAPGEGAGLLAERRRGAAAARARAGVARERGGLKVGGAAAAAGARARVQVARGQVGLAPPRCPRGRRARRGRGGGERGAPQHREEVEGQTKRMCHLRPLINSSRSRLAPPKVELILSLDPRCPEAVVLCEERPFRLGRSSRSDCPRRAAARVRAASAARRCATLRAGGRGWRRATPSRSRACARVRVRARARVSVPVFAT